MSIVFGKSVWNGGTKEDGNFIVPGLTGNCGVERKGGTTLLGRWIGSGDRTTTIEKKK